MSDEQSFINEVNDELRRDQLFGYVRRYGWIAGLVVLLLVGGAAFNEYRTAQARAEREARGDLILTAVSAETPEARAEALAAVSDAERGLIGTLLLAAEQEQAGNRTAARATLEALSGTDLDPLYRDLVALKLQMLGAGTVDERRTALDALAQPGRPFRLLAAEQLAYVELEAGDTEAAIDRLTRIIQDAEVTPGLRDRAQSLLVALGAETPDQLDAGEVE